MNSIGMKTTKTVKIGETVGLSIIRKAIITWPKTQVDRSGIAAIALILGTYRISLKPQSKWTT